MSLACASFNACHTYNRATTPNALWGALSDQLAIIEGFGTTLTMRAPQKGRYRTVLRRRHWYKNP